MRMFADANDFPADVLLQNGEVECDSDGAIFGVGGRQRIPQPFFLQLHHPLDGGGLAGVLHLAGEGNVATNQTLRFGRCDVASGLAKDGYLKSYTSEWGNGEIGGGAGREGEVRCYMAASWVQ